MFSSTGHRPRTEQQCAAPTRKQLGDAPVAGLVDEEGQRRERRRRQEQNGAAREGVLQRPAHVQLHVERPVHVHRVRRHQRHGEQRAVDDPLGDGVQRRRGDDTMRQRRELRGELEDEDGRAPQREPRREQPHPAPLLEARVAGVPDPVPERRGRERQHHGPERAARPLVPQERHDAAPRLALGRGREQGDIRPEEHRADSGREAAHTERQERHRTERGRLRKGAEKGPVGVRQERGARQCGEAMGERAERRQGDRGPREESVRERGGGENETERQQAGAAVAPAAKRQMRGARREEYEQREQEPAGGRSGPRSGGYKEHRGDGGHHLERSHPRYSADEQPSGEIYRRSQGRFMQNTPLINAHSGRVAAIRSQTSCCCAVSSWAV